MDNTPKFEGEKMKIPASVTSHGEIVAERETKGAFIFVLIAALVMIFVGIFYWYLTASKIDTLPPTPSRPTAEMNKEPETTTATAQVESFGALSTSDEITALEADLESTDLSNLDAELGQIDAELEAAILQ